MKGSGHETAEMMATRAANRLRIAQALQGGRLWPTFLGYGDDEPKFFRAPQLGTVATRE